MGPPALLRFRRNSAQRHALARLEREICARDPHSRRKYLRDFTSAFRDYESVLEPGGLAAAYRAADVLLVGDYHALPASQHFTAALVQQIARERPVVLALEMVFSHDQEILEDWRQGAISLAELRQRLRFDRDWGYDWEPYRRVLESGREHAIAIYGLDCLPRSDLRRIGTRDRHAAAKIAEIRERHPAAALVALFGESHLAPKHVPELLQACLPEDQILTVLQNVDALYWRAAGEMCQRVEAVRVGSNTVCVFHATPLEKYESYRLWLDRWHNENVKTPDWTPAFSNLVDALLRFLNIAPNSIFSPNEPQAMTSRLPEVYSNPSEKGMRRFLMRKLSSESEIRRLLDKLGEQGCCFVPELQTVLVCDFRLAQGAEEAARFVHHICRGSIGPSAGLEDRFYAEVIEHALACFGSRVLDAPRPPVRQRDLYAQYTLPQKAAEALRVGSHREFLQCVDFLVLHKDYEANLPRYRECPSLLSEGVRRQGKPFQFLTRQLGYMLGSELYDRYLSGRITKRFLRSLFFRRLDRPGVPRSVYFATQRRLRRRKS
jgi:hypothetical protein